MRFLLLFVLFGCDPDAKQDDPAVDEDGDGFSVADDCDDTNAQIRPDASEVCDGVDQDCDGVIDDDPINGSTVYPDVDGDGYGDDAAATTSCDAGLTQGGDCDDGDAGVNPEASETCDGVDEDCDGAIDEDGADLGTWYPDADGDGFAPSDATGVEACAAPDGHTESLGDCDDSDAAVYAGAPEDQTNGRDDDCDGAIDERGFAVGDLVITEIARQTWFEGTSSDADGAWFEVYNASDVAIDLALWSIERTNDIVGTDGFLVDPALSPVVAPGGRAVFCKTERYAAGVDDGSTLPCDYLIGDPTQRDGWSTTYQDNTFNLQRDADTLTVSAVLDATSGLVVVDTVSWSYDAGSEWPREAQRTMQLDAASHTAAANDAREAWCAAPVEGAAWWTNGEVSERGTPGAANVECGG